jgi:hypothetical protein
MNGTLVCDAELVIIEFDGRSGIRYHNTPRNTFCICIQDDPETPPDE